MEYIYLFSIIAFSIGFIYIVFSMARTLFNDKIADRKRQIIIDSINAPRMERLCIAAGLYQLPCGCKCGFIGNSSDEMEKHFDQCEIYSEHIMDLIRERNE